MCVAIPCKVISTDGLKAVVDAGGARKEVSALLLDGISVGDYVLVHAGFAIQKIEKEYAEETIRTFNETVALLADYDRSELFYESGE